MKKAAPRKKAPAAPKKAAKPRTKKAAAAPRPPHIDFPREGESIRSEHYAFRIDAPQECASVEIAVDGGPWLACRAAVGYWWFDWTGFAGGTHTIESRLTDAAGVTGLSVRRRCVVSL